MTDIVVIGGGVIGLSIAYELAGQGAAVRVCDQGQLGQEASWAGAGIIPPGNPAFARDLESRLRAESFALWPEWTRRLRDETGLDNGFVCCGGIEVPCGDERDELSVIAEHWRRAGCLVQECTSAGLRELEPGLNPEISAAVVLPELCQVRNPWHSKALVAACRNRGVQLFPETPIVGFDRQDARVTAAQTASGRMAADQFVVSSGAWTGNVLKSAGLRIAIEPVRGQIVLLNASPLPVRRVIEVGSRYLVPRSDGHVLIGSTEEWVGFDKSNTAEAVAGLIEFGIRLVPSLKSARLERCWAGLRPHARFGLPYIGRVPDSDNLFVAAGHFRLGLTLSPITAVLTRQLLLGQPPDFAIDELMPR